MWMADIVMAFVLLSLSSTSQELSLNTSDKSRIISGSLQGCIIVVARGQKLNILGTHIDVGLMCKVKVPA